MNGEHEWNEGRTIEVWPQLRGTRAGRRTACGAVEACIAHLDNLGMWYRIRDAALWQDAEAVAEDAQLAMVMNEIAEPDHHRHHEYLFLRETLAPAMILAARDALADQQRLTRWGWRFWTRIAGEDPDDTPGGGPPEGSAAGAWARGGALDEDTEAHKFVQMRDADDGTEQWAFVG